MSAKAEREAAPTEAIEHLRKVLKPGDRLYTVLRHVSASGMSRKIDVFHITPEGPVYLSGYVARVLRERRDDKSGAIVIAGAGMDMGFEIVYQLGRVLFPDGFVPKDAGFTSGRNFTPATERDNDGGYALKQEWL